MVDALGKTHSASPTSNVGPDPEAAPIEEQGLGWASTFTAAALAQMPLLILVNSMNQTPTQWSNYFFECTYRGYAARSPAGAIQFEAVDAPEIIRIRSIRRRNVNRQCW